MEEAQRHQDACVESQRLRLNAEEELRHIREQIRSLDRGQDQRPAALDIHAADVLPHQGPIHAPLSTQHGDELEAAVQKAEARWRLAESRATEAEEEAAAARRSVAGKNPLGVVNLPRRTLFSLCLPLYLPLCLPLCL